MGILHDDYITEKCLTICSVLTLGSKEVLHQGAEGIAAL